MVGRSTTAEPHGIEVVRRFLERRGVPYEVLEHDPTYSAAAEARAAGADLAATAKTVVLHDRDGYRLAVIPASERLDVHRARELLGGSHHLRLATEQELRQDVPAFEPGAWPPFGTTRLPELVDVGLLRHEQIVCAGGEHRCSIKIAALDLLRVSEPRVAEICEHPEERDPPGKLPFH
jgi:Ala-tRNA(Pro) deacylase